MVPGYIIKRKNMNLKVSKKTTVLLLLAILTSSLTAHAITADDLIKLSGFQGGLIVNVGSTNGKLTADLAADNNAIVQSLLLDLEQIDAARNTNLNGRVTVTARDGEVLPYADNMVNLLIAHNEKDISIKEIDRVLAPLSIAMINKNGRWTKHGKPWPDEIDEWTHHLHGPDNIPVAKDTIVAPPKYMQWVAGPMYARSHEINTSMAAMVTAAGKLFYVWDEEVIGLVDKRMPDAWTLIARDAFNGALLWKRPIPDYGWRKWHDESIWDDYLVRAKMLRNAPPTLGRRLVANKDKLYVTLGYEAPVSILDAATGKVLNEIPNTKNTDEIICDDDILLLRIRTADSPPEKNAWLTMPPQSGYILAVNAKDGKTLWQSKAETVSPLSLATKNGKVFYSNYKQLVCLDRKTGKELWRTEPVQLAEEYKIPKAGSLVAMDKVVLYKTNRITAFDTETGKILWQAPKGIKSSLFIADGLLWTSIFDEKAARSGTKVHRMGLDPLTGETVREISVPKLKSPGHHPRCYVSKATERYLMLNKRGIEYLDLTGDEHMRTDWLRAPCIYGSMPANGLTYMAPHQCVCYPGVLLSNFNVMTAHNTQPKSKAKRLQKGPAYGKVKASPPMPNSDWPTYRHDAKRSGRTNTTIANNPKQKWQTQLTAPITPPVSANGKLYVAEKDNHKVIALDSATGKQIWQYTAAGRIDSPPTIHGKLVLFGSADGNVYCLQASNGKLVWRFQAAPTQRQILVYDQLESTWPVHGSVLLQHDRILGKPLAYVTAGRSSYLDGGIYVYALDPYTGKVIYQTRLDGPHPDPQKDTGAAGYMEGAKSDILTSDGADIYLFQERFSSNLKRFPSPMENLGPQGGGFRLYPAQPNRNSSGKHLMAIGGFLDDTYNEGTYWTYDTRWPGWDRKMSRLTSPYAKLLSFDEKLVYGAHLLTKNVRVRRGFTPGETGCRISASKHNPEMFESEKDKRRKKGKTLIYKWETYIPVRVRAMVLTKNKLLLAGPADIVPEDDPAVSFKPNAQSVLTTISRESGKVINEKKLNETPAFDGLIAAEGRLFMSCKNGVVLCLGN